MNKFNILSNYKNQITYLIISIFIIIGLIIFALIISNTNFYIKNLGTSLEQNGKLINTISVTGNGQIFAKPDMAIINVTVSELANNSDTALKNANDKVSNIIGILNSNSINSNDIETSNLNIFPEYNYNGNIRNLTGQRANISLNIKIKNLDSTSTKATRIIDQISKIDMIQIDSISFDIENRTMLFSKARELAINKASQKATELARLSGVKLLKPVSISDVTQEANSNPLNLSSTNIQQQNIALPISLNENKSIQSISSGQLQVSVNINVIYGIE